MDAQASRIRLIEQGGGGQATIRSESTCPTLLKPLTPLRRHAPRSRCHTSDVSPQNEPDENLHCIVTHSRLPDVASRDYGEGDRIERRGSFGHTHLPRRDQDPGGGITNQGCSGDLRQYDLHGHRRQSAALQIPELEIGRLISAGESGDYESRCQTSLFQRRHDREDLRIYRRFPDDC